MKAAASHQARVDSGVKRLAAMVANLPPLRGVERRTLDPVLSEYRRVAVEFLGPDAPALVVDKFRYKPDDEALTELAEMQEALHQFLPALLPAARLPIP